ncbi:MAG: hypothetical protein K1060chlam2_00227 [Chlamydiae bacterium]|nr:hypothetical protein [Chlamydiota bacterium]
MANGVSHYLKASGDHYADPQNFMMLLSVASMVAGRSATLLGKDLSKIANIGKITALTGSLFIFWNFGDRAKKPWAAVTDVKTYVWDHRHEEISAENIRDDEINEEFPTEKYSPAWWAGRCVCEAALKTFATFTIVYAALNAIEAVKSAPSAKLKLCGTISSIGARLISVYEQHRKRDEGPIKDVPDDDEDRYELLQARNCTTEQLKTAASIFIDLVGVVGALSTIYGTESLFGRVSKWSSDLYMVGFTAFESINLLQELSSGAEMKHLESLL